MSWAWADAAECKGEDLELFYGPGESEAPEQTEERQARERVALEVCQECEVRPQCLEEALEHTVQYGVWGGMTEEERTELRRQHERESQAQSKPELTVSALGTMRRLRALGRAGHGVDVVAGLTGASPSTIAAARAGRRTEVMAWVAKAVTAVYPGLLASPPGRAAAQVRQSAAAAGWHTAADWAGQDIDAPAARPCNSADSAA
ncbi:WhiB family transcriptional regulator [Nocardiopsis terrae]|uniref:WhiB family transcriptional regulator n=1 Tax=Streptomyces sp. NPDC057554 TaxID=3350538 RepID=UPI0036906A82